MIEVLRGQEMDFQSPGGETQDRKIGGQSLRDRIRRGSSPNKASTVGKGVGGEAQGLNKKIPVGTRRGAITWVCPQRV
jgi:hypothetical protein